MRVLKVGLYENVIQRQPVPVYVKIYSDQILLTDNAWFWQSGKREHKCILEALF